MTLSTNSTRAVVLGGAAAGGYALFSATDGTIRKNGESTMLWGGVASLLGAYVGAIATMGVLTVTGLAPKGCAP